MIEYAIEDTRLLIELYRQLKDELQAKGRLSWVEEECELLSRVRTISRGEEAFFLRFKGAAGMEGRTLAVLEELLRFRDEQAKLRDVPPLKSWAVIPFANWPRRSRASQAIWQA